jgi:hypothetical protein
MTPFSWGYRGLVRATYNSVQTFIATGVNIEQTLRFSHDVEGNSYLTGNFVQDRKSATWSTSLNYPNSITGSIGYTWFWGADTNNQLRDRDNASITVSLSF